jgi:hypothetical protein
MGRSRRNENHSTTPSAAELDDLAEEGTLSEIKLQFWKRYRTKHPVEITPFRPFAVLLVQEHTGRSQPENIIVFIAACRALSLRW